MNDKELEFIDSREFSKAALEMLKKAIDDAIAHGCYDDILNYPEPSIN